jgi:hypothetical protein
VSVREFARLDGCDEKLVRNAVKRGKLPVLDGGKLDPALAGTGWRRRNRRAAEGADSADSAEKSAPAPTEAELLQSLQDLGWTAETDEDFVAAVLAGRFRITGNAERVKENALAAKHLLAVRRDAGDLVDLEVAEAVLFDQARTIRDAWLNWPSRVGPLIAAELGVAADAVVGALVKHVQQQLEDLGEPDAHFGSGED